jgi:hypothetical protein
MMAGEGWEEVAEGIETWIGSVAHLSKAGSTSATA